MTNKKLNGSTERLACALRDMIAEERTHSSKTLTDQQEHFSETLAELREVTADLKRAADRLAAS